MDRTPSWRAQAAIVAGSGAGMYLSIGIVLIYGFSVFVVPIAEDTGWDRTMVAAVAALRLPVLCMLLGARRRTPSAESAAAVLRPSSQAAKS